MLSCGHETEAFGVPICRHLRECRQSEIQYVKWYVGRGLDFQLLCVPCADAPHPLEAAESSRVCEACFEFASREVGDLFASRGQPGILVRDEPFETGLQAVPIPRELGTIVDLGAVEDVAGSVWVLLNEDAENGPARSPAFDRCASTARPESWSKSKKAN